MKKSVFILALTALMTGTLLTGCESPAEKNKEAQAKLEVAQHNLDAAQKDANDKAQKAAVAEEWRIFKNDSQTKINNNETRIAELRAAVKKAGNKVDKAVSNTIEELEKKNKDLVKKMDEHEKTQGDWEAFKREFSADMDALGQALKDLVVDNKK